MQRVVLVPVLCLALAGCNSGGRSGPDLTQDPGQCGKFQWGTPEMAQCLDTVSAARAEAARPVQAVEPAPLPSPPQPHLQPAPPQAQVQQQPPSAAALPATADAPASVPEVPVAPDTEPAPKSWWPWR
ncbi:hypothetical protein [Bosea sp. PAMC 26642]|uniref:hypothetical protein n=1 Tax=Bosea sp. (strain PAMC 26642) TaxID=1792307 RepID=UPI00076FE472|nr:hypothetical protein [Bosea sp. PAMC 26642]AMJ61623.1 hypothetical protein AXW83_16070 [Bosea sp. PAMC 26642]